MLNNWQHIIDMNGLFWQYPVQTEKEFYFQNRFDYKYIGFPWATVLDKGMSFEKVIEYLKSYVPSQDGLYTCCQHIRFRELISVFESLNISILYTPHKILEEDKIGPVSLRACPLYAVNVEDADRNTEFQNKDFLKVNRKYLYSFMGGLQPGYLSSIRSEIFKLSSGPNTYIQNTGGWHFNEMVYTNFQNANGTKNTSPLHRSRTSKYNQVIIDSRFSLCPSGTGPNSIRFWESLAVGAIPILLSDTLELPTDATWEHTILRVHEKDIFKLDDILSNVTTEEEILLRKNCLHMYKKYKDNYSQLQMDK